MSALIIVLIVIAIIIVVVIIVLIVAASEASNNNNNTPVTIPYGGVCTVTGATSNCARNLTCVTVGTQNVCKRNNGEICSTSVECLPGSTCSNSICIGTSAQTNDILYAGWTSPNTNITVKSLAYNPGADEFYVLNFSNGIQMSLPHVLSADGKSIAQIPKDSSNPNYKFFFNVDGNVSSKNPIPSYIISLSGLNFGSTIVVDANSAVAVNTVTLYNQNLKTYLSLIVNIIVLSWNSLYPAPVIFSAWGQPSSPQIIVNSLTYSDKGQDFNYINLRRQAYISSDNTPVDAMQITYFLPSILSPAGKTISQIPKDGSNPNYKFFFNDLDGNVTSKNGLLYGTYVNNIYAVKITFEPQIITDRSTVVVVKSIDFYNSVRKEYLSLDIGNSTSFGYVNISWSSLYPLPLTM